MTNTLFTNDNLFILHGLNSEIADLIYLDPPFNSKRMHAAPIGSKAAGASFKDMWTWKDVNGAYLETLVGQYPALAHFILAIQDVHSKPMAAYIAYMAQRMIECHRVLKPTGSLYLHCDPTASHYLKGLLDIVFGSVNFKNEIIWWYDTGGMSKTSFSRKHDVILYYSKNEKLNHIYLENVMDKRNEDQLKRIEYSKKHVEKHGYTTYRLSSTEKYPHDVWKIHAINPKAKERTGYPTQKPLSLMHRIIKASSKEGDLVLDPFCGCATTCVAAQQLNRNWIGIDIERQASKILIERLSDDALLFKDFVHRSDIPKRTDIVEIAITVSVKERLFGDQKGACNGCGTVFEIRHFEVDHIVPRAKGGGDYIENFQLLCGSCNRIKGDRPMEYLMNRLRVIESAHRRISFGD